MPPGNNYMANELHRWGYMTDDQLRTRLRRITKRGKLEAFATVALQRGSQTLFEAAEARARELNLFFDTGVLGRNRDRRDMEFVDRMPFSGLQGRTVTGRTRSGDANFQEIERNDSDFVEAVSVDYAEVERRYAATGNVIHEELASQDESIISDDGKVTLDALLNGNTIYEGPLDGQDWRGLPSKKKPVRVIRFKKGKDNE